MVPLRAVSTSTAPVDLKRAPLKPNLRPFLNHLRLVALECRSKARSDLFEACALLSISKDDARKAHAEALMRCLDQALGKRPVLFRPGVDEISFDEAWLIQLATALNAQDHDSASFLLNSRIARHNRRQIRFLVGQVSERFSQV